MQSLRKQLVPKVLIIEDTVELAEVIQATLESMDIESFHETHGERGVELYKKIQPDLLLLDIALPDTKGWKVLEQIKAYTQQNEGATMPKVIIISAYGDPANRLMGKLQDVTRYLIKPFTPDEVEAVVSGALGLNAEQKVDLPQQSTDETISDVLGFINEIRQQAAAAAASLGNVSEGAVASSTSTQKDDATTKSDDKPDASTTSTTNDS